MNIFDLREKYGPVFVSETADGPIPWKLLPVGEFLEYEHQLKFSQVPPAVLEDEIFKKCVLDSVIKDSIDLLKAGTVSSVAAAIMANSGPQSIQELNHVLIIQRHRATQPLHQIVSVICQGFPAYTPEHIYTMDFNTMMLRLAQSEAKLLSMGFLKEPIQFTDQDTGDASTEVAKPKRAKVDLGKLKTEFDKVHPAPTLDPPVTPIKSNSPKGIITKDDMTEHLLAYTGHEMEDRMIHEHQMVKETAPVYQDYLNEIKKGKKITNLNDIKSYEQRVADAKKRVEVSKKKFLEAQRKKR